MGSRAAAALARQLSDDTEDNVQGVICLSFPLHPPRQKDAYQQRSEDLRQLPQHMAVLFVSGTEDDMCDTVRISCCVMFVLLDLYYLLVTGFFVNVLNL